MKLKYPFKLLHIVPFSLSFCLIFFFSPTNSLGNNLESTHLLLPVPCDAVESQNESESQDLREGYIVIML